MEGTPYVRVRMDPDLWERLDVAVRAVDPDDNRSAWLRRAARYAVGDIDTPPQRPANKIPHPDAPAEPGTGDHDDG